MSPAPQRPIVIALGGNALCPRCDMGTIDDQSKQARKALAPVADLLKGGRPAVLTHGNGPVVGNIVMRNEAARESIPPMPLYIDDADSQGGIGLLLQMMLGNELRDRNIEREVVSLVTQVLVDPSDPAFKDPTKPIGPFFDEDRATDLARSEGWYFREYDGGSFRRVVPSPTPLRVVESEPIRALMSVGIVPIACGGGGVPVVELDSGHYEGIDAVIDKDLSSGLLAASLDASELVILMESDAIRTGWGTSEERPLSDVSADELDEMSRRGEFQAGTISPKVRAAIEFVRDTGGTAYVCDSESLASALEGSSGTRVLP